MSNKKEFSKKIFITVMTLFIIVIFFAMALMWKTNNTDALSYLIPSISGICATCIGFYMWKSKAENILKISKEMGLDKFKEANEVINSTIASIQSESEV